MLIMQVYKLAETKGGACFQDLVDHLIDKVFTVKGDLILKKGCTLYINKIGGFMPSLAQGFVI
jgi:hypothetical protein